MALTNCRNCKWAKWALAANGRRLFGNWAPCTYKVKIDAIPLSRQNLHYELEREVRVRAYDNKPIKCPAWAKIEK